MIPGSLKEAEARADAGRLLDQFMVSAPDEIDLDTIAWKAAKLSIEYGDLDTAEGRLVADEKGGVIRVNDAIKSLGRRRFIIAHELGHYRLHKAMSVSDTVWDLGNWREGGKEADANVFAGELLMPERLLAPRIKHLSPSLRGMDDLAQEFRTSSLAATVQYLTYTGELCALVITRGQEVAWFRKSSSFQFFLKAQGRPDAYTAVGEILDGKGGDTGGMVPVPAGAWLDRFDRDGKENVYEDSRQIQKYGMIVTLLWAKDDLEYDDGE